MCIYPVKARNCGITMKRLDRSRQVNLVEQGEVTDATRDIERLDVVPDPDRL
jgi:hypothetical protein